MQPVERSNLIHETQIAPRGAGQFGRKSCFGSIWSAKGVSYRVAGRLDGPSVDGLDGKWEA